MQKKIVYLLIALLFFASENAMAEGKRNLPPVSKSVKQAEHPFTLGPGTKDIETEMKVTGQTRTLNMLLVLKNKKDKIDFINVRKDFRREILSTEY